MSREERPDERRVLVVRGDVADGRPVVRAVRQRAVQQLERIEHAWDRSRRPRARRGTCRSTVPPTRPAGCRTRPAGRDRRPRAARERLARRRAPRRSSWPRCRARPAATRAAPLDPRRRPARPPPARIAPRRSSSIPSGVSSAPGPSMSTNESGNSSSVVYPAASQSHTDSTPTPSDPVRAAAPGERQAAQRSRERVLRIVGLDVGEHRVEDVGDAHRLARTDDLDLHLLPAPGPAAARRAQPRSRCSRPSSQACRARQHDVIDDERRELQRAEASRDPASHDPPITRPAMPAPPPGRTNRRRRARRRPRSGSGR